MSCGPVDGKFRLLDAFVGWDEETSPAEITGFDDPAGLRLAAVAPGAVDARVWGWLWPARLARGCTACDLYLLTPTPVRLLVRSGCEPCWSPRWPAGCAPEGLETAQVVAASGYLLALADAHGVRVWSREGRFERVPIALPGVRATAFESDGGLIAVTDEALHRFSPAGIPRGEPRPLPDDEAVAQSVAQSVARPIAGPIARPIARPIAVAPGPWLLTEDDDGRLRLWHGGPWRAATLDELAASGLPATGLDRVEDDGFCLGDCCCTWYGRPWEPPPVESGPALFATDGTVLTRALDSGVPRCRWHRVTLDADVPAGTGVSVQIATTDDPDAAVDDGDWTPARARHGELDFLIAQPPGRWLRVRIDLHGDGRRTPVLRRVRLDFPRLTSLDSLPPVFRDNPRAEDFTERFLSLFDAGTAELDAAIDQFPAALDAATAREEFLPWLGSFLDLAVDPAWSADRQRRLIAALPRLYQRRGTIEGLRLAVRLVFDLDITVQELALERAWGRLGSSSSSSSDDCNGARLGAVRLFSRARSRFALGRSALSQAPLRSWGRPELDAASSGAYRFRVLVPPNPTLTPVVRQRLERLIEAQKPAHTQMRLTSGGAGFVLGRSAAIGIDSLLAPLPAPVLGPSGLGNVRLRAGSVLWPARNAAPRPRLVLGEPVLTGIHTVLE